MLVIVLGSEFTDKNPLPILPILPWPRFMFVLGLMAALYLLHVIARRMPTGLPAGGRPVIFFWYASQLSLIGLVFLRNDGESLLYFLRTSVHLTLYIVFVLLFLKFASLPNTVHFLKLYYALGVFAALFALLQTIHGRFGVFGWMSNLTLMSGEYRQMGFRSASVFGEPSSAGRYFVHWIALSIAFYVGSQSGRYLFATALFFLAAYATGSLAGFFTLIAFVGVLCAAQLGGSRFSIPLSAKLLALLAVSGVLVLLLLLVNGLVSFAPPDMIRATSERIDLIRMGIGGGFAVRLDSALSALKVWALSPIFGVGLGNTRLYIVEFFSVQDTFIRSYFGSDSMYTQVLAETGVIGLGAFLMLIKHLVTMPAGVSTRIAGGVDPLVIVLRLLQLDFIAQAIGMVNYSDLLSPHLWVVIALILALKQHVSARRAENLDRVPAAAPALIL